MFKHAMILLIACLFSSAHADQNDPAAYKDWNATVNFLQSRGIDAAKINWTSIQTLCAGGRDNELAYNKCKLTKALDQNQYGLDNKYCNSVSETKYLEFIKPILSHETFQDTTGKSIDGIITHEVTLTDQQAAEYKNSSYTSCMRHQGWNDPNGWEQGKRIK